MKTLPVANTGARLPRAARDTDPGAGTQGEVVHPVRMTPVFASPGRRAFAKVGPQQMGELWMPVVDRRRGWTKVLLPSRPNSSAGWLRTRDVERRTTPYEVRVHLGSRTMELVEEGDVVGSWTVAIGAADTPTPTGRTFLLGLIQDENQSFSDYILPLGAHSASLDSYGGGPGTVAFHGWPDSSVFGQAVSHGCIRVPDDALAQLRQVPLGSLVRVDGA
jgi:lipoprotein-anchoring transpeptidase ErfK/SrfK